MPLPPQLSGKASKSKKKSQMTDVMDELTHGKVNSPARKATSGKQRQKQNIGIALKNTGQSKNPHDHAKAAGRTAAHPAKSGHPSRVGAKHRKVRNKGRH